MRVLEVVSLGLAAYALVLQLREMRGQRAQNPALAAAMADFSARTGIPETAIDVVELTAVSWPSLYHRLEGWRIVLEAAGRRYEYHTDAAGRVGAPVNVLTFT